MLFWLFLCFIFLCLNVLYECIKLVRWIVLHDCFLLYSYSLYYDIVQRREIEFIPHEALQMLVGTTCGGSCVGGVHGD